MASVDLKDRFRGCMVGMAVGDALGAASEFMKERQVRETFGVLRDYYGTFEFAEGEFTDDTSMALAIAESIIAVESIDAEDIAGRFVEWMEADGRGIGNLTLQALRLIKRDGMPPSQAGYRAWEMSGKTSAGNGAVMRCAPIALYNWQDPDSLLNESILVSQITHFDPRCCWSCVALNTAIAAVLNDGQGPLESAIEAAAGSCPELADALEAAKHQDLASMHLDGADMGYTILTTQAAFAAFRQFNRFEDGIIALVNKGGDADTNAAVTGALLGARSGMSEIPSRWVENLVDLERVVTAADGLYEMAAG